VGQKVHPVGFRLGGLKTWNSRWYSEKDYVKFIHEDLKIRDFIKKGFYHAGISKVDIERSGNKVKVIIYTSRPGIIIGKKGVEIENLKKDLNKIIDEDSLIDIHIQEVRKPECDAQLIAENIALQLERRISHRRAMKKSILSALKFGAKGIKIACAGRLAGAEIARTEWYKEGRIPLQTLRADIDYGFAESKTTYGIIGVKVWVFKKEILDMRRD
jgi:small subunit ribosomal protein S3